MTTYNVHHSDPKLLATLLDPTPPQTAQWDEQELAAILRHQTRTAISFHLSRIPGPYARQVLAVAEEDDLLLKSLGDLLFHPQPPLILLRKTKEYAKAHCASPEGQLPPEVARILYLAAIVAARVRWGERITEQDDASLRSALNWAMSLSWLEEPFQSLFAKGLAEFDA